MTQPLSADEIPEPSPEFEGLKRAHYALITRYIAVLAKASEVPLLRLRWRFWQKGDYPLVSRFLIGPFIQSHIRQRVGVLAEAYFQRGLTFADEGSGAAQRQWLKDAGEGCEKLATKLTSVRGIRGLIATALPFVPGIILQRKIGIVDLGRSDLLTFVLLGVWPVTYLVTAIGWSFTYKQDVLKKTDGFAATQTGETDGEGLSTYALEDQLFAQLGRGKPKDPPLSKFLSSLGLFGLGCFIVASEISRSSLETLFGLAIVAIALASSVNEFRKAEWL